MDGQGPHQLPFGRITSGIEESRLVLQTINFVRRQLPAWRDDPDRTDGKSEPRLNLDLCKFLERHARDDFPMVQFVHDELQNGRRSVDVSALAIESTLYSAYEPFIVFECKRLPAPSRNREREYVTGETKKSGGIQRFKLGLHAPNLEVVGMIGYVQKHSAQHWYGQINEWISQLSEGTTKDGCVWTEHDRLDPLEEDPSMGIANCRSAHTRIGDVMNPELTIYHLWIVMNAKIRKSSKN